LPLITRSAPQQMKPRFGKRRHNDCWILPWDPWHHRTGTLQNTLFPGGRDKGRGKEWTRHGVYWIASLRKKGAIPRVIRCE
jgi:hypothetical protein